jgi:hypothetical protein
VVHPRGTVSATTPDGARPAREAVNVKVSVLGREAMTLDGDTVMVPAAACGVLALLVAAADGLDVVAGVAAVTSGVTRTRGDDARVASVPPLADSSEAAKVAEPANAGAVPV